MDDLVRTVVPLIGAAGIVLAALALITTRRIGTALPVLLDFLLAAGLLRLSATLSWRAIASAALVVVIRKIVVLGITTGTRARHGSPAPS